MPSNPAVISEIDGIISITREKTRTLLNIVSPKFESEAYPYFDDYVPTVKNGDLVKAKQAIAAALDKKAVRSMISGEVRVDAKNKVITVTSKERIAREYEIPSQTTLNIENNSEVKKGDILTEGHLDLSQSLKLRGKINTQKYITRCIQEIYTSQGQAINEKHVEIMLKQMFSKVLIKDGGDSDFLQGQIVDKFEVKKMNEDFKKKNKKTVEFEEVILGVTRVALKTESFLSAASFQETTGILIDASVKGKVDNLRGLKENVIIGKLIPAGTGFRKISANYSN